MSIEFKPWWKLLRRKSNIRQCNYRLTEPRHLVQGVVEGVLVILINPAVLPVYQRAYAALENNIGSSNKAGEISVSFKILTLVHTYLDK